QIDVIVRRTRFRLRRAEEQIHIFRGYLKALDALDEVIALIRRSPDVDEARTGLMDLLEIDEIQANAILAMQLRRLAALERQKIIEEHDRLQALIEEYTAILADPQKQRDIVSEELAEIVDRYGDDRRTEILPFAGDMAMEDLIPEEDMVVTITRGATSSAPGRTSTEPRNAAARGCGGPRCARTTWSSTSSPPPPTAGCCSSPTRAASTAPRVMSCPRRRGTRRASTWRT